MIIERKGDRRKSVSSFRTQPQYERRKSGSDPRACATPLEWSTAQTGAIRPGAGEVVAHERRRFPDAGTE